MGILDTHQMEYGRQVFLLLLQLPQNDYSKGLVDYNFINEAQHITRPLVKKIIGGGTQNFWEFYDSETGAPSHAQNYIWGATVLPMAEFARIQN